MMKVISPLPEEAILSATKGKRVVTIEENLKSGGMGEKLFSLLKENNHQQQVMNISPKDGFYFNFGDRKLLHEVAKIDKNSLYEKIKEFINLCERK